MDGPRLAASLYARSACAVVCACALALTMQPKVLLFDEPTSALDPTLVGEVLKAMLELARSGMTMMVVTHELGFAFEIADRIVFLDQGQIVADGKPSDVLLNPVHERLKVFVGRFHESAEMLRPFLDAKARAAASSVGCATASKQAEPVKRATSARLAGVPSRSTTASRTWRTSSVTAYPKISVWTTGRPRITNRMRGSRRTERNSLRRMARMRSPMVSGGGPG